MLLALLGATAGQGVVWYTGQFYALFFLTITLKLDYLTAYTVVGISLALATPFFIVFGRLSDRIGRLKIILAGCLIAALTYFPLFKGLTHFVNPALEEYNAANPITVAAGDCNFHVFVGPRDGVHRLRPGQGLPHQGRAVLRVAAGRARADGRHPHRRRSSSPAGTRRATRRRWRRPAIRPRWTSRGSTI